MIGFDAGDVRLPLTPLTSGNAATLRAALIDLGFDVRACIHG